MVIDSAVDVAVIIAMMSVDLNLEEKLMLKIFLADDEDPWLQLTRKALSQFGDVTAVTHVSAIDDHVIAPFMTDPNAAPFDLVVLDNNMQVRGVGIQTLCGLRECGYTQPVIIHSADLMPMEERTVADNDGLFIRKKTDCGELVEKVQTILASKKPAPA